MTRRMWKSPSGPAPAPANFPYLETIVNAFQEAYPNIHVDFQNQGPVSDLMDKLTQNIVAKSTPTLSNVSPTYFKEYIDSGAIIDLADYYNHSEIGFTAEEKACFSARPSLRRRKASAARAHSMASPPTKRPPRFSSTTRPILMPRAGAPLLPGTRWRPTVS